ncbi:hypothetical protein LCGC14_1195630 [marine sediment metagenome]|uniref:Uncharacterized protein n=1 Tax=marine sediment metagenome TaxID=412755 RepID=A0A0F9LMZ6_9ZZZZ
MVLSDHLKYPHNIYNEDGSRFFHPGYEEYACRVCNKISIRSKGIAVILCGRDSCAKDWDYGSRV